jgi:hypothetical protein
MRETPLVPFVVTLRGGESFPVNTTARLLLGPDSFCYLDDQGYFRILPYRAVDRVTTTQTPEVR